MAATILVHVAMSLGVSTKKDSLTSQNAAEPRNIVVLLKFPSSPKILAVHNFRVVKNISYDRTWQHLLNAFKQKESALAMLFSPTPAPPPLCNPVKNE